MKELLDSLISEVNNLKLRQYDDSMYIVKAQNDGFITGLQFVIYKILTINKYESTKPTTI